MLSILLLLQIKEVLMNLLKKSFLLACIISFWTCHQSLKIVTTTSFELVTDGQYPIKIKLPSSIKSFPYMQIQDKQQQKMYPAQRLDDSTFLFLATNRQFKVTEAIQIVPSDKSLKEEINIEKSTDALLVTKHNKPILKYQMTEQLPLGKLEYYKRGGFIHPIYSPNGTILTDDFPAGHTHQHAVFFAFVNTSYKEEKLDFWNQHQQTATIEFDSLINYESGPLFGRFETIQNHISLKYGPILKEKWEVIIYNTVPYRIDIQTTLQSIATDTLFVKEYHYGGMAFRGAKAWNAVDSLHFQNEPDFYTHEGKNRQAANHSRPLWSAMNGLIDGKKAGVAILGHPSNFRYPEPIRIHPTMPYYCVAPMVGQAFVIPPNGAFQATYTYLSYDGAVPVEALDELAIFLKDTSPSQ